MDVLHIPFHQYLDIRKADDGFVFCMKEQPVMLNHVGSIHACIQLALAEASAGEFLLQQFFAYKDLLVPVVRKTEAKYSKPARGTLFSKVEFFQCNREDLLPLIKYKSRFGLQTRVEICNENKEKTLVVIFDWFLSKIP